MNYNICRTNWGYTIQGLMSEYDPTCTRVLMCPHVPLLVGQVDDRIAAGDTFTSPHGVFEVVSFHVRQVGESATEAKARRARIRRLEAALRNA